MPGRPEGHTHREVVVRLRQKIHEVLDPLLPRDVPYALLDFPNHGNVGDSAIWLGERAHLQGVGVSVTYRCDLLSYSEEALARQSQNGIVLCHGGGNMGDVWPRYQRFRETVVAAFPDRRIIFLPQSVRFSDAANLRQAKACFDAHPDLTIVVRDQRSLEVVRNEFRATSLLCPDMAFALGSLPRPEGSGREILWLLRTDKESAGHVLHTGDPFARQRDWLPTMRWANILGDEYVTRLTSQPPRVLRRLSPVVSRTYDVLARSRLRRGCRILNRARIVVTDRLHGHILCLLMGIPHVILDNNYGKLRSFHETWTKGCDVVRWADSPDEALEHVRMLLKA